MSVSKRRAFGMMLALIVILLIGVISAIVVNTSAMSAKATSDRYVRYQAELLADSGIDYALMRVGAFDTTMGTPANAADDDCLKSLTIAVNDAGGTPAYTITNTFAYAFKGAAPANCTGVNVLAQNTGRDTTVVIDTTVTANQANLGLTEPVQIHRRTVQKP